MEKRIKINSKSYDTKTLIWLCAKEMGLPSDISQHALCKEITIRFGYQGHIDKILFDYSKKLLNAYRKKKRAEAKNQPKPVKLTKEAVAKKTEALHKIGERFAESNLKKQNTLAVQKLSQQLDLMKIKYIREKKVVTKCSKIYGEPKLFIFDFYLVGLGIALEADGGYHTDPVQRKKDRDRDSIVESQKIAIMMRITNEEILREDFSLVDVFMSRKVYKDKLAKFYNKLSKQNDSQRTFH